MRYLQQQVLDLQVEALSLKVKQTEWQKNNAYKWQNGSSTTSPQTFENGKRTNNKKTILHANNQIMKSQEDHGQFSWHMKEMDNAAKVGNKKRKW